jgi:apolipoprotein N-acyltransferase
MSALIAATLAAVVCSVWIRRDTGRSRWEAGASLACLGAIGFAYGSARSWQAKVAWFAPGKKLPPQPSR